MAKTLLVIGFVWPEPNSSAAGSRILQLIKVLQSQHYTITFASPAAKGNNAFNLSLINVTQIKIELNKPNFNTFVKQLNPDIVLFDRFMMEEQFGWRVATYCPNALRILDTEDLHCLRKGRQQALKDASKFNDTYLFSDIAKREIASIYRCDISLIISKSEMNILVSKFKVPEHILLYLPFLLDTITEQSINQLPKHQDRSHFVSIGNFLHPPNYDAVQFLKKRIWPLIRKQLPKAELHIYGAYVSQKAMQLHSVKEGFLVKGYTPSVSKIMQLSRVCLAPLRFGAGLKGKLIDAMKYGTPCVMTTVASEGMYDNGITNGPIEDMPIEFANKAVSLYCNLKQWEAFQNNGFRTINKRFNYKKFETTFIKKLQMVLSHLNTHRLQNFTGQILQHHQLQSTKYMSKWIEEKNKKS